MLQSNLQLMNGLTYSRCEKFSLHPLLDILLIIVELYSRRTNLRCNLIVSHMLFLTCFSMEEIDSACQDAVNGLPSRRPIIEMTIPSVLDKTLSPPGTSNVLS